MFLAEPFDSTTGRSRNDPLGANFLLFSQPGALRKELAIMAKPEFRPGEKPDISGQYELVGPRGGGTGREVTGVADKPLPPTPGPGMGYNLVDPTKHKS
jgi:hypothetical protein